MVMRWRWTFDLPDGPPYDPHMTFYMTFYMTPHTAYPRNRLMTFAKGRLVGLMGSQVRCGQALVGKIKLFPLLCFISLLLFLITPAQADVWGYIDSRGVAHFASERLDDRYELFFKGGECFDTAKVAPVAIDTPRPAAAAAAAPAIAAVPPRLLAFFDASPNYKTVKPHLHEAAKTHKIDYELLQALIATESGFDAAAVSPKGAIGLMQVMPDTARRFGVETDKKMAIEQKLADPKINVKTGSRYLRLLLNMFPGRLDLALASYNAGEGAVQRAGNQIPNYKETQNYVKTVMGLYFGLKPPVVQAQPAAVEPRFPTRIRMEMLGGAARRGNMLLPTAPAAAESGDLNSGQGSGLNNGLNSGSNSGLSKSQSPGQPPDQHASQPDTKQATD